MSTIGELPNFLARETCAAGAGKATVVFLSTPISTRFAGNTQRTTTRTEAAANGNAVGNRQRTVLTAERLPGNGENFRRRMCGHGRRIDAPMECQVRMINLLSGLSGGAKHVGYGGPGCVVLAGADHSSLQLFVGVDEVEACVSEQAMGSGIG